MSSLCDQGYYSLCVTEVTNHLVCELVFASINNMCIRCPVSLQYTAWRQGDDGHWTEHQFIVRRRHKEFVALQQRLGVYPAYKSELKGQHSEFCKCSETYLKNSA